MPWLPPSSQLAPPASLRWQVVKICVPGTPLCTQSLQFRNREPSSQMKKRRPVRTSKTWQGTDSVGGRAHRNHTKLQAKETGQQFRQHKYIKQEERMSAVSGRKTPHLQLALRLSSNHPSASGLTLPPLSGCGFFSPSFARVTPELASQAQEAETNRCHSHCP